LYKRERVEQSENLIYFFDFACLNPHPKEHPDLGSKNKIEYVVWKFERNDNCLTITVEGKINHYQVKAGSLSISLTDQFLGEIDKICSVSSATLD
jgi:hypothetical protein